MGVGGQSGASRPTVGGIGDDQASRVGGHLVVNRLAGGAVEGEQTGKGELLGASRLACRVI